MNLRLLPLLLLSLLLACGDDEDCCLMPCGPEIEFVGEVEAPESDAFNLLDATVEGLCLTVEIGASGCSTSRWGLRLQTAGEVLESSPTQTSARLVFDVPVRDLVCEAYLTRSYTFDLSPYLADGDRPTYFSLIGTDTVLMIR